MVKYSVQDLIIKGEKCIDEFQPDLAIKFFKKVLDIEPNHSEIFDKIGELYTEINDPEKALQSFEKSIQLNPSSNPIKYMYMAQLLSGDEAVQTYLEGIRYLNEELNSIKGRKEEDQEFFLIVQKQICEAYCSLSEIYMTDLCDNEDAETLYEKYIEKAFEYDHELPGPTQSLANLRIIQNRKEDAIRLLDTTYDRIIKCEEDTIPVIEFRISTGKLLIEVEKFDKAADILEGVMLEDDDNPEIWYLVGLCYYKLKDFINALDFLTKCSTMLQSLKKEMKKDFYLQNELNKVNSMIAAINDEKLDNIESNHLYEPDCEDAMQLE